MDYCDKMDNCPLKNKTASTAKADCCDKSDDCPLKKQNTEKQTSEIDMKNVTVMTAQAAVNPARIAAKAVRVAKAKTKPKPK